MSTLPSLEKFLRTPMEEELTLSHDISVVNSFLTKWRLKLSVEKTVCSVFHLKNHSANYQLNVNLQPSVTVKFDPLPSYLGTCLDRSLRFRTHLHTLKKKVSSRVALIKRLASAGWELASSSKNLLLGSCVCSGRVLCSSVVPQRSHKAHRCTFKRVDAHYHWLPAGDKISPTSFLPILSGITPPKKRHSASCLKLYSKTFNPKHLLHKTMYLKPSPQSLRSRKPLRSFVELLLTNGEPTTPIPPTLQSFIPAFGPQPPGCDLPRNAGVQLNRLRTGVGRFADNMKLFGVCGSDLCVCGKVQTAHHILHDQTKFKPPCHIYEVQ